MRIPILHRLAPRYCRIAVSKIREPSIDAGISNGLSSYLVYNPGTSGGDSGGGAFTGELVGQAVINAIVIVCVIAAATFVLVACYYFRLIKLMVAYLIFASMNLLGYSGGFMAVTAISVWKIPVDWATLAVVMLNFAVGGVVAVFWQKGVPRAVTQGYLVAVSVIMAWILTKLPEWTSWALLVALALYDLCAVLTPCGPLKWLVHLAQKPGAQPIPGLLYEANVGGSGDSDAGRVRDTLATSGGVRKAATGASTTGPTRSSGGAPGATGSTDSELAARQRMMQLLSQKAAQEQAQPREATSAPAPVIDVVDADAALAAALQAEEEEAGRANGAVPGSAASPSPGDVEQALDSVRDWGSAKSSARSVFSSSGVSSSGRGRGNSSSGPTASKRYLPTAQASSSGGSGYSRTMPLVSRSDEETGHAVTATAAGVVAAPEGDNDDEEEFELVGDRSIKLGLGDFVFYSVLVARAALFDMSTFAATFVAVILGLGGTLFLLGVFKMALPALPISIFLGVALYFATRLAITPMLIETSLNGVGL